MLASRVVAVAATMMLKMLLRARVVVFMSVIQPVLFAAIAGLLFRIGGRGQLTLAGALGAGVMGVWSAILFFSGGMLTRERRQGTLEMLVAAPAPLLQPVAGGCLATAMLAFHSLLSTAAAAMLFFGAPLRVARPGMLAVAVLVVVASMAMFGVMLAAMFVLYRQAGIFQNMLEYPVWIACGLLVPLATLPMPVRAVGWLLAPTWGNEALRRAVTGDGLVGPTLGACMALGVIYLAVGATLLRVAERRARILASLPLS